MFSTLLRRSLPLLTLLGLFALVFAPANHQPVRALDDDACAATPAHVAGQGRFVYGGQGRFVYGGQNGDEAIDIPPSEAVSSAWATQILAGAAHGNEPVILMIVDDFSTPIAHGRWVAQTVFDNLQVINMMAANRGLPTPNIMVDFVDMANLPELAGEDFTVKALATEIDNRIQGYISNAEGQPVNVVINMSFAFIPCEEPDIGFSFETFIENWNEQFSDIQSTDGVVSGKLCGELEVPSGNCPLDGSPGYGNYSLYQEILNLDGSSQTLGTLLTDPEYDPLMDPLIILFDNYAATWDDWLSGNLSERPAHVIPVASSGNYGDILEEDGFPRDPLAPARWSSVMSISAPAAFNPESKDGMSPPTLDFAQDGNVEAEGAWFDFTGELLPGFYPSPGTMRTILPEWSAFPGDGRFRAGTSFATPLIATSLALQATQPNAYKLCDTFDGSLPLSSGEADLWNNLTYESAISCPMMDNQAAIAEGGIGDVEVRFENFPSGVEPGTNFTYEIVVTVSNTEYVGGLQIDHVLPNTGDATGQVIDITRGLFSETNNIWYLGAVRELTIDGATDTAVMTVSVNVPPEASIGDINLSASTTLSDANTENNADTISIPIVLPAAVVRISPLDGATVETTSVPLSWEKDAVASAYHVQIAGGPNSINFDQWFQAVNICDSSVCSLNTPNLFNGDYTWTMTAATMNNSGPTDTTSFTVEVPGIPRIHPADGTTILGTDGPWQSFSFQPIEGATWYAVWVGTSNGVERLYKWYPATDDSTGAGPDEGICDLEISECIVPDDIWLNNNNFQWWMTHWGPEPGFTDYNEYWHRSLFRVEFEAPTTIQNRAPSGQVNQATVLSWDHDPNALWYRIWLGTDDYATVELFDWFDARNICDGEVCEIILSEEGVSLGNDGYEWWMEVWGPASYQQWIVNGAENFDLQP